MEFILGTLESRMEMLGQYLPDNAGTDAINTISTAPSATDRRSARFISSPRRHRRGGRTVAATCARAARDRSAATCPHLLIRAVHANRQTQWSDKYLRAVHDFTVGSPIRLAPDRLLLAEVPLSYPLSTS